MFDSIITSNLNPISFFACIGVAFVLGLIVAFTHMKTARASRHFSTTLVILPVIVAMAIMLVNGNLGAGVATMGIFSLVRFRSIAGNSRSLLSVFLSMTIGLACGTGYVAFAAVFTVIVAAMIAALSCFHFGEHNLACKKLVVMIPEDLDYTTVFDDIFAHYTTKHQLEKVKTTNMGALFELKYAISLKDKVNEKEFIDKLRVKNGNLKVTLSHTLEDEEL